MIDFFYNLTSSEVWVYFISSFFSYLFIDKGIKKIDYADPKIKKRFEGKSVSVFIAFVPYLNTVYALICIIAFSYGFFKKRK